MAHTTDDFQEKLTELDELLQKSVQESLSREEKREQRISYAMGMLPHDSKTTRKEIEELADQIYG